MFPVRYSGSSQLMWLQCSHSSNFSSALVRDEDRGEDRKGVRDEDIFIIKKSSTTKTEKLTSSVKKILF